MNLPVDETIKSLLNQKLVDLETHFKADFLSYYGPIQDGSETWFLRVVEELASDPGKKNALFVMLTTPGGSATVVERFVNILRHHYSEVNFIVPDYAYSAGTIFCMSGDSIHMDFFSVLGPIDPQVTNKEGHLVAALGYLDKVNELVEKAKANTLTQAEFLILKDLDLAELRGYEQAKELTVDLLKKWLVKYKFKNWAVHTSTPNLVGQVVTPEEKIQRAEEIADKLGDNKVWKSHSRPINIETLEKDLKLKIEDYGHLATKVFMHTRRFI
jgi:Serine dehydrogenase proteinase